MKRLAMLVVLAVMLVSILAGVVYVMPGGGGGCTGDSIVIVFPKTYTEEQKNRFMTALRDALARYGVHGYGYCAKSEDEVKGLRVYPAVLVQGRLDPKLQELVSGSHEGYALIDYAVPTIVAMQLGLPIEYRAKAVLVIVNGTTKWGRVAENLNVTRFVELVEAIAAAKVEKVEYADYQRYKLPYYPGVVLLSSTDLSQGNRYVVSLGDGVYTFNDNTLLQLAAIAGNSVVEVAKPIELPASTPVLGNRSAPALLAIFEDFACPYCAKFYKTMYPSIVEPLVREGKLAVAFLDLIVHSQVELLHEYAWCVYNVTGDAKAYEDLVKTIYSVLSGEGTPPTLEELVSMVKSKHGQEVSSKALDCVKKELGSKHISESKRLAQQLGARGTPTLAVVTGNVTIVIHGLPRPEVLSEILAYATSRG